MVDIHQDVIVITIHTLNIQLRCPPTGIYHGWWTVLRHTERRSSVFTSPRDGVMLVPGPNTSGIATMLHPVTVMANVVERGRVGIYPSRADS